LCEPVTVKCPSALRSSAPLEIQQPSLEKSEPAIKPVCDAEVNSGHDSNAIQALKDQGYEVGGPVVHPDDFTRATVLAAGWATLEEIMNWRRSQHRSSAEWTGVKLPVHSADA